MNARRQLAKEAKHTAHLSDKATLSINNISKFIHGSCYVASSRNSCKAIHVQWWWNLVVMNLGLLWMVLLL